VTDLEDELVPPSRGVRADDRARLGEPIPTQVELPVEVEILGKHLEVDRSDSQRREIATNAGT
jgi:hypothetical protein